MHVYPPTHENISCTYILTHTVTVNVFSTLLFSIDRPSRQKLNREMFGLNNVINQKDLVDVYRKSHLIVKEYTFFSAALGTSSKIDQTLDQKATDERNLK